MKVRKKEKTEDRRVDVHTDSKTMGRIDRVSRGSKRRLTDSWKDGQTKLLTEDRTNSKTSTYDSFLFIEK